MIQEQLPHKTKPIDLQSCLCVNNNTLLSLCADQDCPYEPFCCSDPYCKCNALHENCKKVHGKQFIQKLNRKVNIVTNIKNQVACLFDNLKSKLTEIQKQITTTIKQQSITKAQNILIEYLQDNKSIEIEGKLINQVRGQHKIGINLNYLIDVQNQVDMLWKEKGHLVWGVIDQTEEIYKKMKKIEISQIENIDKEQQYAREFSDLMSELSQEFDNYNKQSQQAKHQQKQKQNNEILSPSDTVNHLQLHLKQANTQVLQQKVEDTNDSWLSQYLLSNPEEQYISELVLNDIQTQLSVEKAKFISLIDRNDPIFKESFISLSNIFNANYQSAQNFVLQNGHNQKTSLLFGEEKILQLWMKKHTI